MASKLLFSVSDKADGHDVTPETVPLGLLKEFVKDVSAFIRGSGKELDPSGLLVSVVPGSFALQSYEDVPADLAIWHDIEQLSKGLLDEVDPKRAAVAEKWRVDAVKHPARIFRIADTANSRVVAINANTFFRRQAATDWVLAERYVSGIVEDWGGMTAPNIHLRLSDGSLLKIDATKDQIHDEERNLVYHPVVVRVELEENLATAERRNVRFLSFVNYSPRADEKDYERATAAGRLAWRDVEDSVEWVRDIRGGKE